jgi:hypothetical protein
MNPCVCIVVHDVAPATWPECQQLFAMLAELGSPPITLLVVPNFHGRGLIVDALLARRGIDRWLAGGSEVALHGLVHQDDLSLPSGPAAWLARRVMTAGEGEFAALSAAQADQRIARGLEIFARCGWQPDGFVPPAWLASAGTMEALRHHPLRYTSTLMSLVVPSERRKVPAPCLTASVRSAQRRLASRLVLSAVQAATRTMPLVRVALHPADACHPGLMGFWQRTLVRLLARRQPVTKSYAVQQALREPQPN